MKGTFYYFLLSVLLSTGSHAQEKDQYGGFTDIKGEKTGFFHAEKIDGRWWLITPEGNAFYGIGMAHPVTGFTQSAVTFAYGNNQEAWLKGTVQRMKDLGFNCVWSGPYCPERLQNNFVNKELAEKVFSEAKIPYVFPIPLIKHNVELAPGESQPDVFSDAYSAHAKQLIAKYVTGLKDNPWVMGYYYGFGSWDVEEKWINSTINRKESAGRERFMNILEERYKGDIKKFNTVYSATYKSFEDLKKNGILKYPRWIKQLKFGRGKMPKIEGAQEMFNDAQALLGEMIEHVYKLGYQEIRKIDKNHLVFGSYVKEATLTTEMWERVAPYIDVIAPQHVSRVFPIDPIVEKLNKPALLSDQPLGNVYAPDLLMTKGAFGPVADHVDRLVLYDILADRMAKDPNFIGIDLCAVLFDQSHPNKAYELGQPGFFTITGEPKYHLCNTAKALNKQILEEVKGTPDSEAVKEHNHKFHEILDHHRAVINGRKELLKQHPAVAYPYE